MAFFDQIKSAFSGIVQYFRGGRAQRDADLALKYASEALPYISIAADIVTGLTPTQVDDLAWQLVKAKFPKLFDGSIHTPDELKMYALGIASTLLQKKIPYLSTTVAVLATQIAFTQLKADGAAPQPVAPSTDAIILNVKPPQKSPLAL